MPVPFSSFGDIVSVLQLAWQLRAALSAATGASAEIRTLIADVDTFTRALQQTRAAIEQRLTPLQPDAENGIKHAILACRDVLVLILNKVASFEARITSALGARAWHGYWAVAAWSILGGRKAVDALRTRLSEQLGVVQIYLSLSHSNDQNSVLEAVECQANTLQKMYRVLQDIHLRFDVGVPTFHFFNSKTKQYYQPFARPSLLRIVKLFEAFGSEPDPQNLHRTLQTVDPGIKQHYMRLHLLKTRLLGQRTYWIQLDCLFFRERAFDEWQVLLGMPVHWADSPCMVKNLKCLLERRYALAETGPSDRTTVKTGTNPGSTPTCAIFQIICQTAHLSDGKDAMWNRVLDRFGGFSKIRELEPAANPLVKIFDGVWTRGDFVLTWGCGKLPFAAVVRNSRLANRPNAQLGQWKVPAEGSDTLVLSPDPVSPKLVQHSRRRASDDSNTPMRSRSKSV